MENAHKSLWKETAVTNYSSVLVCRLESIDVEGRPIVSAPNTSASGGVVAKSLVPVDSRQIGREVAILFESGDPQKPIIMGFVGLDAAAPTEELKGDWPAEPPSERGRANGIYLYRLVGFEESTNRVLVVPQNGSSEPVAACAATVLGPNDLGRDVAVSWVPGSQERLVLGVIQTEIDADESVETSVPLIRENGRLVLRAEEEIIIESGKSRITLAPSGKLTIRGRDIFSRASRSQRIKGGSVQIN